GALPVRAPDGATRGAVLHRRLLLRGHRRLRHGPAAPSRGTASCAADDVQRPEPGLAAAVRRDRRTAVPGRTARCGAATAEAAARPEDPGRPRRPREDRSVHAALPVAREAEAGAPDLVQAEPQVRPPAAGDGSGGLLPADA